MSQITVLEIANQLRSQLGGAVYSNEYDLQELIHNVLDGPHERELHLSDGNSRIDFFLRLDEWIFGSRIDHQWGIGIEVKTNGSLADVIRQLDRYAACPEIDDLILVTTRAKHHRMPSFVGRREIPIHLVSLIQNGL